MNFMQLRPMVLFMSVFPVFSGVAMANDDSHASMTLGTEQQKYSYAVGYGIGSGMVQNDMHIDMDVFNAAINDALAGDAPRISEQEMRAAAESVQRKKGEARMALGKKVEKEGLAFLEKNKKEKGVVALPSGLQYQILHKGNGKKPALNDTVSVHYSGTLLDGSVFDSSYERGVPATFQVQGVIQGWQEGLQLMDVGAKWKLFIPASLAYGDRGAGASIGPGETLIFDVELLEIK